MFELGFEPVEAVEQVLRHHPSLADHRHEIGIAFPARHDMPMEMRLDAGAGAFAEIHAQVDAAGIEGLADDFDGLAQDLVNFDKGFAGQLGEIVFVAFGRNQEMAVVIRVFVHHDDRMLSLRQDQRGS